MHETVFYAATGWMAVQLTVGVAFLIRAPTAMIRILALDTVTLVLVALLVLYAASRQSAHYLDAALILALLSFASTIAAARYHSEGKVF